MATNKKAAKSPRFSDALITAGLLRLTSARHITDKHAMSAEWAVIPELRSGSGYGKSERYLDLFAMNMWPSKKHHRVAYELKASRADFLREMNKPDKRAWGMEVSNEFWYVCYPGVAKPEEIPAGCGLLQSNPDLTKLTRVVVAPQREARDLSMAEVAAIARRSTSERTALFQYAGRELSEEDLETILEARRGQSEYQAIREKASELSHQQLTVASRTLQRYAQDLESVGIAPPAWMLANDLSQLISWDAASWAKDAFLRKPGFEDLKAQALSLSQSLRAVERLQESLTTAHTQTNALLAVRGANSETPQNV